MTSIEFSELMAMSRIEPGIFYPEYLFGRMCAAVVNCFAKSGSKGYSVADFFDLFKDETEQSEEEMIALLDMAVASAGAADKSNKTLMVRKH